MPSAYQASSKEPLTNGHGDALTLGHGACTHGNACPSVPCVLRPRCCRKSNTLPRNPDCEPALSHGNLSACSSLSPREAFTIPGHRPPALAASIPPVCSCFNPSRIGWRRICTSRHAARCDLAHSSSRFCNTDPFACKDLGGSVCRTLNVADAIHLRLVRTTKRLRHHASRPTCARLADARATPEAQKFMEAVVVRTTGAVKRASVMPRAPPLSLRPLRRQVLWKSRGVWPRSCGAGVREWCLCS